MQIKGISDVVHQSGISATWFVDVQSHQSSMNQFSEMDGQEIGVHCFKHQTFADYDRNVQNIQKAQAVLRNVKISPKGFAAPYGRWNEALARAIVDSGFEYSSEFSYDYDNMPGVPMLPERMGTLQLPVHPICVGSLKRHGYSEEQMIRYFAGVVQRKLRVREPIMFYHHPNDGHLQVLEWMFQEMRRERVPAKTMGEYARWWKMRTTSIPGMRFTKGSLHLHGVQPEKKSLYLRIAQLDGTEAIIPASKQIVLGTVRWGPRPSAWVMPDDYLRSRRLNYRIPLIRGLDAVYHFIRKHEP